QEEAAERLGQTRMAQVALYVVQWSLVQLLGSWGLEAEAMIGQSLGEYTAATVAGVLRIGDGLRLVARRGKLMQEQGPGAMLAVAVGEGEARQYVKEDVWLAAVNSDRQSVMAGSQEAIGRLRRELSEAGIANQLLATRQAYHTGLMEGARAGLEEEMRGV